MFLKAMKIPGDRKLFLVSDTHFNHDVDFVRGARGYNSVSEMDDAIVSTWNSVVGAGDVVFHLGDFVLKDPLALKAESLLKRLNGVKYLLLGNHNSGLKVLIKKSVKCTSDDGTVWGYKIDDNAFVVGHYVSVLHQRQGLVLCHFPFASWDGMDEGMWHLCGHSHGSYAPSTPQNSSGGLILDVGWDVHGKPLSFAEVADIMKTKTRITVGHHQKETHE